MAHQLIWTRQAEEDYRQIQGYLLDNWPHPIAERFANEVLSKLDILETMPYFGKQVEGRLRAVKLGTHRSGEAVLRSLLRHRG